MSGQAGSVATTSLLTGVQFFVMSGFNPIAFAVGLAVGAAVGALGLLLQPKKQKQNREVSALRTTSNKDMAVPVLFGRARVGGNYLVIGNFHFYGTKVVDNQGRVYLLHAAIGLCEGPIQAIGNLRIENKPKKQAYKELQEKKVYPEGISEDATFLVNLYPGTSTQDIPAMILDTETTTESTKTNGFLDPDNPGRYIGSNAIIIPWRNTALVTSQIYTGYDTGMPSITVDAIGPDFTLRSSGSDTITGTDEIGNVIYDSYTEAWYFTLTDSSESSPWGMVKIPRDGSEREYMAAPSGIDTDISRAWYLGRHDIVLIQDPGNPELFWFGYWGMDASDTEWEYYKPDINYVWPIIADHLDEANGILHSLHHNTVTGDWYFMRMNLLTGTTNRVDTAVSPGTVQAMLYSPDIHSYVVADGSNIYVINPENGNLTASTGSITLTGLRGFFVSGNRIGVITTSGCRYWDYAIGDVSSLLGNSTTGTGAGHFGGTIRAVQNTYTGQVTLSKDNSTLINFIPSVVEELSDISAMGSPGQDEFQTAPTDNVAAWVRDWSYRDASGWSLVQLEGNSSLAAAMWSSLVKVDALNTERWGGGLDASLFSMPSFESLHSRCVAGWRYANEPYGGTGTEAAPTYRYAEKYKFDFLLDNVSSLTNLVLNDMLGACNGFRYIHGGKMHVGISNMGSFPCWHFNQNNINDNTIKVSDISRTGDINRLRVRYIDARNEYRGDYAQADNEYDQNKMQRLALQEISLSGIARRGQGEIVAKQSLDMIGTPRRHVEFDCYFLAFILVPNDIIEVTHESVALSRTPFRVTEFKEKEGKNLTVIGDEHIITYDNLQDYPSRNGPVAGDVPVTDPGSDPVLNPDCSYVVAKTSSNPASQRVQNVVWFEKGAAFGKGTYTIYYVTGSAKTIDDRWTATGYKVVTRDDADSVNDVASAPADAGTYDSEDEAVMASTGQYLTFTIDYIQPLGIVLDTDVFLYDGNGATGNPSWELCLGTVDTRMVPPPDSGSGGGYGSDSIIDFADCVFCSSATYSLTVTRPDGQQFPVTLTNFPMGSGCPSYSGTDPFSGLGVSVTGAYAGTPGGMDYVVTWTISYSSTTTALKVTTSSACAAGTYPEVGGSGSYLVS